MNPLEAYFRANRGRKISKWPHYFRIYDRHFSPYRGGDVSVMEFGVGHGGSLQMWRDYFGPRSRITGVDIDPGCAVLTGEGISVVTGDQEDREFLRSLTGVAGPPDIVIDDGGHTMGQQIATLEEMWPQLRDGGVFLTEDVHTSYWGAYGGGYRRPGTFVEYAKDLIDRVNAWHSEDRGALKPDAWTRSVAGMHVYDSVVVLDKDQVRPPPPAEVTGGGDAERHERMSEQDAYDAHAAGEQAAADRQGHYHGNVTGQGANAGDPQPAESTLQPVPPNMRPAVSDADPVGSL